MKLLLTLTTALLLKPITTSSLSSSPLQDISVVLNGVREEMDALEPAIEEVGTQNVKSISETLTRERMERYERVKERWLVDNVRRIVKKSLRGDTESQVRITPFPIEDVVSDEALSEDDLPSVATQTKLVDMLSEKLEKAKRGTVTQELDSDGLTKIAVRTRDEAEIREAEEALEIASEVLRKGKHLKVLTQRIGNATDPDVIANLTRDAEKARVEALNALRKQETFTSESFAKLPEKLETSLRALGVQANDTMKAIRREREAEKAAAYADEAYREAKEELRERAEKERLEEEERAAEKAELSSKMNESESKIRELQNENAAMRETVEEKRASVMAKKNELKELAKQSEDLEKTLSEMKGEDSE